MRIRFNKETVGVIILLLSTFIALFIADWIIPYRKSNFTYIRSSIDVSLKMIGIYCLYKK